MTISRKNKTICDYNTNILNIVEDCKSTSIDENNFLEVFNFLIDKIDDIEKLAEQSLTAGQNMEDRLYEYRQAIEELGFIRNKKGDLS